MRDAFIALCCGLGGLLMFWSLFLWGQNIDTLEKRLLPEKLHWILQWQLIVWLFLALLCSVSAIIFGHKSYTQLNAGATVSPFMLVIAGLVVGYGFWALHSQCSPQWQVALYLLLPLFLLGGAIVAIRFGYVNVDTIVAVAGLILGFINLPIVVIGIVFAVIAWGNS